MVIFAQNTSVMNLQQIVEPLAKIVDDTFRVFLVPISEGFNWVVIAGGFIGLFIWLKLQNGYNRKAKENNTIA